MQTSLLRRLLCQTAALGQKPDKGYIDDAMAISTAGGFLYVNTDGTKFATLRAVALPPGKRAQSAGCSGCDAACRAARRSAAASAASQGVKGEADADASLCQPFHRHPTPFMEEWLARELLAGPTGMKELFVGAAAQYQPAASFVGRPRAGGDARSRDIGALHREHCSLKTRAEVPVPGGIGPATDIT